MSATAAAAAVALVVAALAIQPATSAQTSSPATVASSSGSALLAGSALAPVPWSASPQAAAPARARLAAASLAPAPAHASIGPPWRMHQYVAQQPRWSASNCTAEVLARATDITAPGAVVECARIRTALDWTQLSAGSITLGLTRVRDSRALQQNQTRAGSSAARRRLLLVNPGGPGMSADWLAPALVTGTPSLLGTHTVVAVDPRGVGASTPITCPLVEAGVADLRSPSARTLARLQAATQATVRGCVAANGRLLAHLSSYDMAGDLDLVRRVHGLAQIDFYGVSAGTWLGARYGQQYPHAVGRFVLDGNTDFTGTWRHSFALQPLGFQRRLEQQFFSWAARHHRLYRLGATRTQVAASYAAVRSAAAAGRLPGVNARSFDAQTVADLYHDAGFMDLATRLREQRARIARAPARGAASGSAPVAGEYEADPSDTVFMAVQCNDEAASRSPGSYAAQGRALGRRYPLTGWEWLTSPCAYWPYAPKPAALRAAARPLPAMLMVQTEFDPATPWEGALRAHRASAATRMVAVEDQGSHGAYLSANPCVRAVVNRYWRAGSMPAKDLVCAGLPLPKEQRTYPVGGSVAKLLGAG